MSLVTVVRVVCPESESRSTDRNSETRQNLSRSLKSKVNYLYALQPIDRDAAIPF